MNRKVTKVRYVYDAVNCKNVYRKPPGNLLETSEGNEYGLYTKLILPTSERLCIINVYLPHKSSLARRDIAETQATAELELVLEHLQPQLSTIVCGDFNARVGNRTPVLTQEHPPRTVIDTAALQMIPGIDASAGRTPEILADAAYIIFNRDAKECTGNFFVDDLVLASEGITDLEKYSVTPGTKDFLLDFFLD